MIVAAAIHILEGESAGFTFALPAPARHHTILHKYNLGLLDHIQGFIDSNDGFVTRERAASIAVQEGQIQTPTSQLFSEDLW